MYHYYLKCFLQEGTPAFICIFYQFGDIEYSSFISQDNKFLIKFNPKLQEIKKYETMLSSRLYSSLMFFLLHKDYLFSLFVYPHWMKSYSSIYQLEKTLFYVQIADFKLKHAAVSLFLFVYTVPDLQHLRKRLRTLFQDKQSLFRNKLFSFCIFCKHMSEKNVLTVTINMTSVHVWGEWHLLTPTKTIVLLSVLF